jgi:subtilisin family serine protease
VRRSSSGRSSQRSPRARASATRLTATTNANPSGHPAYGTTGDYLDLAAPGGVSVSGCASKPAVEIVSTWNDGGYCTIAGTSMAALHVSAADALLRAANGACTAALVKSRLKATAGDLGTPGPDSTFGAGLVNPLAAGTFCP